MSHQSMSPETLEMVTFLASRNVMDGILYEPRIYSQLFDFTNAATVRPLASDDATFSNGEQYPVRITHVVAAIRDTGNAQTNDERVVQRFGLRIRAHDTFYQNDDFVVTPLWHNTVVAAADVVTRAQSAWRWGIGRRQPDGTVLAGRPLYMGSRDAFEVKVALEFALNAQTEVTMRVWVTFHGVGAVSRRPKQLAGFFEFNVGHGTSVQSIPTSFYRNDGTEPLEITEMTVHAQAPDASAGADPIGNIRRVRLAVRQTGNGTNQRWSSTPSFQNPVNLVPATLWGITTGRAIVHELPKGDDGYPGWLWYPNEGLTLEVLPNPGVNFPIYVGLAGHIIVK